MEAIVGKSNVGNNWVLIGLSIAMSVTSIYQLLSTQTIVDKLS